MDAHPSGARMHRLPIQRVFVIVTTICVLAGLIVAYPLYSRPSTAHAAGTLLSQNRPATASSIQSSSFPATAAVDGNTGTRWSSAASDPQWLQVDLGAQQTVCGVILQWETAYATAYQIQISSDATNWTTIYSTTTGPGATEILTVSGT